MWPWRRKPTPAPSSASLAETIRNKYLSFRELSTCNNECLELMAGLQEDLQYVPALRDVVEERVAAIFDRARRVVAALERLAGLKQPALAAAVEAQRHEVERYVAAVQELAAPRLAAWLHELTAASTTEVGGKAAALGEIRARLGLPVPDGYVLTTEAYRLFFGIPRWTAIRDAIRDVDLHDLDQLQAISEKLIGMVMEAPVPRAIEVALAERAAVLLKRARGLAVRSSAVGEGGARTYAGQFTSLLNVQPGGLVEAYKRVVASRFSERALFYRLSTGLSEVETSMAVLVLPLLEAAAAGILYSRDPTDPKSKTIWITATRGLGLDIASGRMPADHFVVERAWPHQVLERSITTKEVMLAQLACGGLARLPVPPSEACTPSLPFGHLTTLAEWGVRIEEHFKCPQDIEWVLDATGQLHIVQARPLALVDAAKGWTKLKPKVEPKLSGGRTVFPGRAAGPAFLVEDSSHLRQVPAGAVVFIHRPSPEIVQIFPRIAGLVAEWGNVTGHAATLLREFRVPSVFQMERIFETFRTGDAVSLDSVQARVYEGLLWPQRRLRHFLISEAARDRADPINQRLLALNLLDPSASNFRPSGCRSVHDVLRYCHEKSIEAMFALGDIVIDGEAGGARHLVTKIPLNISVLDLGGGCRAREGVAEITPEEILSRPFQSLWKGLTHPGVCWTREMPASLSDLASVFASALTPQSGAMRPLGEKSFLLVAADYMNLNSRLAYHFSLVDARLSDEPAEDYIAFRFQGGGMSRQRRDLRARFIEECLTHYGFQVDRRGDLVNAWFRKSPAEQTGERLSILGRLLACAGQLDMYMENREVMRWYVKQFLAGNYSLHPPSAKE